MHSIGMGSNVESVMAHHNNQKEDNKIDATLMTTKQIME